MEEFKLSNYKGKHFVIKDEITSEDISFCGDEIGVMTKKQVLDKKFIEEHKSSCDYYGIPCYIGKDIDLNKIYRK
ncbi:MAG: hypothetical protein KAR54_00895 [Candidatus Pacebacteria bacterium]|nr:hypothetical protein [Candidatus Paceibacterota bacterium]